MDKNVEFNLLAKKYIKDTKCDGQLFCGCRSDDCSGYGTNACLTCLRSLLLEQHIKEVAEELGEIKKHEISMENSWLYQQPCYGSKKVEFPIYIKITRPGIYEARIEENNIEVEKMVGRR